MPGAARPSLPFLGQPSLGSTGLGKIFFTNNANKDFPRLYDCILALHNLLSKNLL
jgi:hypothetical protein